MSLNSWKVLRIPVKSSEDPQKSLMSLFGNCKPPPGYQVLLTAHWGRGLVGGRWEGQEVYLCTRRATLVSFTWGEQLCVYGVSPEEIIETAKDIGLIAANVSPPEIGAALSVL